MRIVAWSLFFLQVIFALPLIAQTPQVLSIPLAPRGSNDKDRRNAVFLYRQVPAAQSFRVVAKIATGGNNALGGLVVGYSPKTGTGYFCGLDDRTQHGYGLYRFQGPKQISLNEVPHNNIPATRYRVEVNVDGKGLRCTIDGTLVGSVDESSLLSSSIGFLGSRVEGDAGTILSAIAVSTQGPDAVLAAKPQEVFQGWTKGEPPLLPRYKHTSAELVPEPFGFYDPLSQEGISFAQTGFGVPGRGKIGVRNGIAYIPPGEGELQAVDIRKPAIPKTVGLVSSKFLAGVSFHPAGYLLMPSSGGLLLSSIGDPAVLGAAERVVLPIAPIIRAIAPLEDGEQSTTFAATTPDGDACFYNLDFKDPRRPLLVGSLSIKGSSGAWYFFQEGTTFFLGLKNGDIAIVDNAKVKQPKLLSLIHPTRGEEWKLLAVKLPRLYFAVGPKQNRLSSLLALDIHAMNSPREVQRLPYQGPTHFDDAAFYGNYLFAVNSVDRPSLHSIPPDRRTTSSIHILSLEPFAEVSRYVEPELAELRSIVFSGDLAIANDYNLGMRIYTVKPPYTLAPLSRHITPAEGHYAASNGNIAAFINTFGGSTHIFDVSGTKAPRQLGSYWDGNWVLSLPAMYKQALYLPTAKRINIIDLGNPAKPIKRATIPHPFLEKPTTQSPRITIVGGIAYVITMEETKPKRYLPLLSLYDLGNPFDPALIASATLPERDGNAYAPTVAVSETFIYAYDASQSTLVKFSRTDKGIEQKGTFTHRELKTSERYNTDYVGRFAVYKDVAYIPYSGPQDKGKPALFVVDFRAKPTLNVLTFPYPSYLVDAQVFGERLLLGDYFFAGIADLSNPAQPRTSTRVDLKGGNIWSLGATAGSALLLPRLDGLSRVDLAQ